MDFGVHQKPRRCPAGDGGGAVETHDPPDGLESVGSCETRVTTFAYFLAIPPLRGRPQGGSSGLSVYVACVSLVPCRRANRTLSSCHL